MEKRVRVYFILAFLFLSAGLGALYIAHRPVSREAAIEGIARRIEKEVAALTAEATTLLDALRENPAIQFQPNDRFSFYLVEDYRVTRWSDHRFVPMIPSIADTFSLKLLREGNSDYLAMRWEIRPRSFLIGVIPLLKKYPITNNYLKPEWNVAVFRGNKVTIIDGNAANGYPVCTDNFGCPIRILFSPDESSVNTSAGIISIVLIFAGIVFLLLALFYILTKLFVADIVFLIFLAAVFLIRVLMTSLNFPSDLISGDLFNPLSFASSALNSSMGDLILNELALYFVCYYFFRNFVHFRSIHYLKARPYGYWLLSVFSALMVLFSMLFPFVVIQTVYNNSSIELAVSEGLTFNGLRIAATLAAVLSGVCAFLFSHGFVRILIGNGDRFRIILSFIIALFIFAGINIESGQVYVSSAILGVFYFLLVWALDLTSTLRKLTFATFTYLFACIFSLAVNGAYAMYYFSHSEKMANMFRFGRNYLTDRDYFAEYLLSDISKKISSDVFIQSRMATPFLSKDAVKHKIRQVFLPSYFNKYDVEIYTFGQTGEPLDNRPGITLQSIIDSHASSSSRTDYPGVYFVNSPAADISQKYMVSIPLQWMKTTAGFVVIELSLKKVIPESVYPELLVDHRFLESFRPQEISYAVYVNNKLSYSSGDFNYEMLFNTSWFGIPALHTLGISDNGYDHIAEEDDAGRIAIVSSRSTPIQHLLANFSFLLVIGVGTILAFLLFQSISSFWRGGKLFFAARIQLFLNLAFFLPLIIVSVMSLQVTNRSSADQINDEYLNRTRRFSEQISGELHKNLIYSFEPLGSFSNQLKDLALLANLDANVYYVTGSLLASSQPLIFENKLLSEYINPSAFLRIRQGDNLFIEIERVGQLEYFTAYAALKAPSSGALIGIAAVPFFQSVYSSEKVQVNILSNILNIFALIFVVLVVLSYFVTRWLTFPLTFITQSLRKTSLTGANQPLVWKADDEIGLMVKEYNQMLFSLSESKAELEQTQREMAWRDMAQQVAHEIKNPLTPMKLTLQQLERSVENGKAGPEKIQKAISSLLIQVNTLNDIASSFSAFAKMPEPVMGEIELVSLLKRIIDLHSPTGEVRLESGIKEVKVLADEQLLGRTFSNLILNALQSAAPGDSVRVEVRLVIHDGHAIIAFIDNGKGIEPHIAERIFVPHFTTKKSGSGLGLAIARQAVEQMKGRLWFTTRIGVGTEFYVALPIISKTS